MRCLIALMVLSRCFRGVVGECCFWCPSSSFFFGVADGVLSLLFCEVVPACRAVSVLVGDVLVAGLACFCHWSSLVFPDELFECDWFDGSELVE